MTLPFVFVLMLIAVLAVIACGKSDPLPALYDECIELAGNFTANLQGTIKESCEKDRDRRVLHEEDPEAAAIEDCINRLLLLGAPGGLVKARCEAGGGTDSDPYVICRDRTFKAAMTSAEIDAECNPLMSESLTSP